VSPEELISPAARRVLRVGHAALRDGILLGRYDRCDGAAHADSGVSRVHALLIQLGEQLVAVDLASTNGTAEVGAPPARSIVMGACTELVLGEVTRVRWRDVP
jgi:pSer/pThr/pTyr-binding forkhead associated (FHA) protein